jgi:hypothetical protein
MLEYLFHEGPIATMTQFELKASHNTKRHVCAAHDCIIGAVHFVLNRKTLRRELLPAAKRRATTIYRKMLKSNNQA